MSSTTLREIDEMWQDELFPPAEDPDPVGGQRVTRFQGYLNQVDWTDQGHVTRALRVFEVAIRPWFSPPEGYTHGLEVVIPRLSRLFQRDGLALDDAGRISGGVHVVIADELLADLSDATVIHEHLDRISAAIERDDPAQAIGSAKELIESTAKLVLRERHVTYSDADDLPALVLKAQQSLAVHPAGRTPGPDGSDAVKKILGAVTTITGGMAELRNRGYGTGHGQGVARTGLSSRHARLAVNAARLWCEFMLDTLSDRHAPWQTASPETGP
jgi:Abortive infection C-terminus